MPPYNIFIVVSLPVTFQKDKIITMCSPGTTILDRITNPILLFFVIIVIGISIITQFPKYHNYTIV